jgi:hypothetical protein
MRTLRLTGASSIFVDTDLGGANISMRGAGSSSTTLARIPVTAAPLATLHYEDSNPNGNLLFENVITGLRIDLTDQWCRPYLATTPYEISLTFTPVMTGRFDLRVDRPSGLAYPPGL